MPHRVWRLAETWRAGVLRPVDRVVAAYNVLIALVWALAWVAAPARAPLGWAAALVHLCLALCPSLLGATVGRVSARVASLVVVGVDLAVDLYPLLVLVGAWPELGQLIGILYRHSYDLIDLWLDQRIFGTHWHLRWFAAMPWPWFAEIMWAAYFSLYPMLIVVPLVLLITKDRAALRDFVFSVTLTHLACFAIYLSFPVLGPWQFGSRAFHVPHGFFYGLSVGVQQAGDALGTACPSTHVAASTTIALVAWRRFSGAIALVFAADALLIALATVYTQNHYAFDVLSGVVVVVALQCAAVPVLEGRPFRLPAFAMRRRVATNLGAGVQSPIAS